MLSGHVTQGRQVIRKLLVGSIRLFPNQQVGRGYRFEATVSFGRFLQGFVDPTSVASPTIPTWNQVSGFLAEMQGLRSVLTPVA
jgi:hypothetical protein